MKNVNIALVGAGTMGRRHVDYIQTGPASTAVAIVDITPQAERFARDKGIAYFTDYERMLDTVKPDGVVLATPNTLHVPMALAALARNVPVLVEKPISDTLESAAVLVEAAKRSGIPVLIGQHRRYAPLMQVAVNLIATGALGQMTAVVGFALRRKPDAYFDAKWRREPGGGPLLINGIHEIDTLRALCGEIDSLQAATSNHVRGFAVEDTLAVTLRFSNGALGTLTLSDAVQAPWCWEINSGEDPKYAREPENSFLICGTKSSLALPTLEHWWNERGGGPADPMIRKHLQVVHADPWLEEIRHFARVIRGTEAPRVPPEDGLRTLAGTLAIKQSAETGQWVRIADLLR